MAARFASWIAAALLALAAAAAAGSVAGQQVRPVEEILMVCGGCHNPDPGTLPASEAQRIPRLGGQQPQYLRVALEAYRTRQRDHFYMRGMAAGLRGAELDAAVRYLSGSDAGPATAGVAAGPAPQAALRCIACHGSTAQPPVTPQTPRLAGQHAPYLEAAFMAYAVNARRHEVMSSQARSANGTPALSEEELRQVASWFSGQRGLVPR